tara:strand:- start:152 stop:448 length:297 start_codon:yes stop_codon:yes gene_type:complete
MNKNVFTWEYLKKNTLAKLAVSGVLVLIGGNLGTDGVLEIESQATFWDYVMYAGIAFPLGYIIFAVIFAWIINPIKGLIKIIKKEEERKVKSNKDITK